MPNEFKQRTVADFAGSTLDLGLNLMLLPESLSWLKPGSPVEVWTVEYVASQFSNKGYWRAGWTVRSVIAQAKDTAGKIALDRATIGTSTARDRKEIIKSAIAQLHLDVWVVVSYGSDQFKFNNTLRLNDVRPTIEASARRELPDDVKDWEDKLRELQDSNLPKPEEQEIDPRRFELDIEDD